MWKKYSYITIHTSIWPINDKTKYSNTELLDTKDRTVMTHVSYHPNTQPAIMVLGGFLPKIKQAVVLACIHAGVFWPSNIRHSTILLGFRSQTFSSIISHVSVITYWHLVTSLCVHFKALGIPLLLLSCSLSYSKRKHQQEK